MQSKTKRLATLGLLAAAAFVLSWLDSMIPVSGVLPGAKLGLANLSVLCGLYLLGRKQGFGLCVLKILLQTFLFGNAYSFFYGLTGGLLSFLVMALLLERASTVFVSVLGGHEPQSWADHCGGGGAENTGALWIFAPVDALWIGRGSGHWRCRRDPYSTDRACCEQKNVKNTPIHRFWWMGVYVCRYSMRDLIFFQKKKVTARAQTSAKGTASQTRLMLPVRLRSQARGTMKKSCRQRFTVRVYRLRPRD